MSNARSAHNKKHRRGGKAARPGTHDYHGKHNSRSQRLLSKIRKGVAPISSKLWKEIASS